MANLATISNNILADSGIDSISVVTGSGTANQIAYWSSGTAIGSLTTATYPSLTELSYVKGVTSAIQTQLNSKQATLTLTTTGTSGAATLVGATLNIPQYSDVGFANPMTTLGDIIYGAASGTATRLAGNTTTTKQYLSQTGTGTASAAPAWATIAGSDITGAALTKTDDTNVTLTLGGTPATALLRAVSLTLGWTGQLSVARGGTGAASFTAGQVLYGNGTSAISSSANLFWDNTNTELGIGTNTPESTLHISKSNAGALGGQFVIDNPAASTVGNTVEISFLTDAGASGTGNRNARILVVNENAGNGAANMQFYTWNGAASAERVRITSAGNVIIGNGDSNATPALGVIRGTNGTGTNIAGAEFRIAGGIGTGTGVGGAITFYTAAAGTTGSTLNTSVERMQINSAGTVRFNAYTTNGLLYVSGGTGTISSAARTINGTTFDGSANITITANTTNAVTFDNGGAGAASGTTFNGSAARTISHNTIGALALTGGTLTGALSGTTASFSTSSNATGVPLLVRNTNAGTAAGGQIGVGNDTTTNGAGIALFSSGFTASGQYRTNGAYVYSNLAGGLTLHAEGANSMYLATNGTAALTINSSQAATFSSSVTAKGTGNYNGFIADNSSSATIGGGYYAAYSFGVQRGIFGVAGAISGAADNNLGIFAEGGLGIKFFVNGSGTASHIMTSGGNVGIGTSSPNIGGVNKALTLNAATSTNASYELAVNDVLQGSLYTGISTSSLNLYTFVNGPLVFGTNSAERMRITSGGNVQIDDSFSSAKFAIRGGTGTYPSSTSATYTLSLNDPTSMAANVGGSILFQGYKTSNTNIGNFAFIVGKKQNGTAGDESGFLGFGTSDSAGTISERMRITSGGNVGIGTASPEALLHVNKSTTGGEGGYIFIDNPAASTLGNKAGIRFATNSGATFSGYGSAIEAVNTNAGNGAEALTFSTWNGSARSERMRLAASGNLLIGETTDASSRLVVRKDSAGGRGGEISIVNYAASTLNSSAALNFGLEASTYDADNGNGQIKSQITNAGNSAADMIFSTWNGSAFGERFRIASAGASTFSSSVTATSFFESSDIRLKTNIKDLDIDVSSICAKIYEKEGVTEVGYIAQDVEGVLSSAISKRGDGYLDLSYRQIHTAKIAMLEKRIKELEEQLKNK